MINNTAVYSTYFGSNKNITFNTHPVDTKYPHYFISNNLYLLNKSLQSGWVPLYHNLPISEDSIISASQAKVPKTLPHLYNELRNYKYLLYKDDKVGIDYSVIDTYTDIISTKKYSMGLNKHPWLSENILLEFLESQGQERYAKQKYQIIDYIDEQVRSGLRLKSQMFQTGIIYRDMEHPDTIKIGTEWLNHIKKCGIECQISFDFVAQKYTSIGLLPSIII